MGHTTVLQDRGYSIPQLITLYGDGITSLHVWVVLPKYPDKLTYSCAKKTDAAYEII